jgi:hypothetical protein
MSTFNWEYYETEMSDINMRLEDPDEREFRELTFKKHSLLRSKHIDSLTYPSSSEEFIESIKYLERDFVGAQFQLLMSKINPEDFDLKYASDTPEGPLVESILRAIEESPMKSELEDRFHKMRLLIKDVRSQSMRLSSSSDRERPYLVQIFIDTVTDNNFKYDNIPEKVREVSLKYRKSLATVENLTPSVADMERAFDIFVETEEYSKDYEILHVDIATPANERLSQIYTNYVRGCKYITKVFDEAMSFIPIRSERGEESLNITKNYASNKLELLIKYYERRARVLKMAFTLSVRKCLEMSTNAKDSDLLKSLLISSPFSKLKDKYKKLNSFISPDSESVELPDLESVWRDDPLDVNEMQLETELFDGDDEVEKEKYTLRLQRVERKKIAESRRVRQDKEMKRRRQDEAIIRYILDNLIHLEYEVDMIDRLVFIHGTSIPRGRLSELVRVAILQRFSEGEVLSTTAAANHKNELNERLQAVQVVESEDDCCISCLVNAKNVSISPCGHRDTCSQCLTRLSNCPICRADVLNFELL